MVEENPGLKPLSFRLRLVVRLKPHPPTGTQLLKAEIER